MGGFLRRMISILGSGSVLLFLASGWVVYYVTLTVWSKEALSRFVVALGNNLAVQAVTFFFLVSLFLFLVKTAGKLIATHKWLFPLWVVFPLGLMLFLGGFYVNGLFYQNGYIVKGVGDQLKPPWEERALTVAGIDPGLRDELLGGTESVLFDYMPTMELQSPEGRRNVGIFPPSKIGGTYYNILDFGLAPAVRVTAEGKTVIDSFVLQRIIPPGKEDSFMLDPLPYRVDLRLAPSRIIRKGDIEAPVFSLKDLQYRVKIHRGENMIFEGVSSDGLFFDGFTLEFPSHIYWVRIQAARSPGMIPLVAGLILMGAGLPLMVVFAVSRLMVSRRSGEART